MAELLFELLAALFEMLFEVFLEVAAEEIFAFLGGLLEVFSDSDESNSILSTVGYLTLGAATGGLSLLLHSHRLFRTSRFHGISLFLSPLVTGSIMSLIGRALRRRGQRRLKRLLMVLPSHWEWPQSDFSSRSKARMQRSAHRCLSFILFAMPTSRLLFVFLAASTCFAYQAPNAADLARWQSEAQRVTIIRDDWGIAHVYGKSDADAVFGAIYAQAEDDFNRVETNYINSIGRLAEAEGESKIYQDLRQKLFVDPEDMKAKYAASPAWLKALMDAFADSLNFYLYKHPNVKPRAIQHFEPWMALTFPEGSIGGDIERVNLKNLQAFYDIGSTVPISELEDDALEEPTGSNGMAISPANTAVHHALLLINPHTSFYFRSELQMVSEGGLDAYGASTWGQFFIYQGFNDRCGWMHTSSGVDAVDEFLETIAKKDDRYYYKYGNEERPLTVKPIIVLFRTDRGMSEKKFTVYYTHHGPIIREQDGKWVSIELMQKPVEQLTQSFIRTKARSYKAYLETMELKANSSNNTIFADADGDIAYFHGNFIPRRDTRFDFTKPVDGSNPATDWKDPLSVEETPHLLNPKSGWLYNSNNAPWSAAGPSSPKREDYPVYVEKGGETARGMHAVRVLENKKDFTLESLITAAYDSYMPWFATTIPALLKVWDSAPAGDPLKIKVADQTALLRDWNFRWSDDSIPTSLAVFWGSDLDKKHRGEWIHGSESGSEYVATKVPPEQMLQSLAAASDKLAADFGSWRTPWGNINRFQRTNDDIAPHFSDAEPSIPVEFVSSEWGSLASFGARAYPGTKKWYGTSGNSFVAVVEFGDKVHAKAVTAGGESGDPSSRHFNDEAKRYSNGNLRDVYFYRDQLKGHTEREYHPGT